MDFNPWEPPAAFRDIAEGIGPYGKRKYDDGFRSGFRIGSLVMTLAWTAWMVWHHSACRVGLW